ncbi:hypothetical protein OGAPHI_002618 [Ogataea philodendri]|uniref:Uncharacterized protein n=1 Tax=Ogataea philodendri TaxID=1378263 RepID=A0A9P8PAZ7_9ASCO|nr:uncharacterized protein OGAPHI_002618 [Ogataea philodendri]KAH3668863.1 hypothetical protein OGAPHI_002618 [Ogataea philodendri]
MATFELRTSRQKGPKLGKVRVNHSLLDENVRNPESIRILALSPFSASNEAGIASTLGMSRKRSTNRELMVSELV